MELFYGNFVSGMSAEGRDLPFTRGPGSNPSVGKHSAYLGALEQDTEVQSPKTQIFLQVKTGFFQTQPFTFFWFSFLIFWYCISAVSLLSPMELATPFVIVKGPQMMPNPGRPSPLVTCPGNPQLLHSPHLSMHIHRSWCPV